MSMQGAAALKFPALHDTGVEAEIAHQVLAVRKAGDVANDGNQRIGRDEIKTTQ